MNKKYLPFFWDYKVSKDQLEKYVKGEEGETTQIWATTRLLESAPYEEIWKYITLDELRTIFPKLKLKQPIKKAWRRALGIWSK